METTKQAHLFLVLSPSPVILEDVARFKEQIRGILGHKFESYHSKAHISILMSSFANANDSLYQIEDDLCSITPFELVVKDFIVFHHGPNYRTICLDIANKNQACAVQEKLPIKKRSRRRFTPHITVAKKLALEEFNKVWKYFQEISYSNYFRCDRLTVLKRSLYKWDPFMEIHFAN